MEMMTEVISQRAFAAAMNVTPQAINKAIKSGRIHGPGLQGKKIVVEIARQQFRDNADPKMTLRDDADRYASAQMQLLGDDDDTAPSAGSYKETKEKIEQAKYDLLQMQLAEKRDELRPRDDVSHAMFTCARQLRGDLDRIADWADDLATLPPDPVSLRAWLGTKVRALQASMMDRLINLKDHDTNGEA